MSLAVIPAGQRQDLCRMLARGKQLGPWTRTAHAAGRSSKHSWLSQLVNRQERLLLSSAKRVPWTVVLESEGVSMAEAQSRPPVLVSKLHLEPGAAEAAAAAAARKVTTKRLLVTAPTAPGVVAPAPAGPASAAGAAMPPLPTARGGAALAPTAPSAASAGTAAGHAAAAVQSAVAAAVGGESQSHGSWVQQLLDGLWPYARDAAQRLAWDTIPGTLEASRPSWVSGQAGARACRRLLVN